MMRRTVLSIVLLVTLVLTLGVNHGLASGPVTLRVMMKQLSPAVFKVWEDAIKAYDSRNPGITVELIVVTNWQAREQKLRSMIAAGIPPDVMVTGSSSFDEAARGAFLPLDEFIRKDNYDLSDFDPRALGLHTWKGKRYALPFGMTTDILYYNKTMFDAAGLPYPPKSKDKRWTWENEFLEAAKKLTVDKDGDGRVDQFGVSTIGWFYYYPWYYGANWVTPDYSRAIFDSKEAIHALQFFADLRNKYHVQPTAIQQRETFGGGNLFLSGICAMETGLPLAIPTYASIKDFEWGIALIPKGTVSANEIFPEVFVILKDTRYPQQAWELIKYMVSAEGQREFAIKGGFVPTRRSLWGEYKEYLSKLVPGIDPQVILDSFDVDNPQYLPCRFGSWQKMNETITSGLEALWLGKSTASEVVRDLIPKVNAILKESIRE